MITFVYIALHALLLLVMLFFCRRIVLNGRNYWRLAIIPILSYGLEEGLRWGRETDWNFYY